ncbi:hypothetical protein [Streptosporangium sp. NPDC049376]|uniref:hypothetical protein n=1 Tax=Streptosporangium sp. NPDC049376 TaxID=3366192 RepID=UPI0037905849
MTHDGPVPSRQRRGRHPDDLPYRQRQLGLGESRPRGEIGFLITDRSMRLRLAHLLDGAGPYIG